MTEFAQKIAALCLKKYPLVKSVPEMVDELLILRFPFSRESIGEAFIYRTRDVLCNMPTVMVQIMHHKGMVIELDSVCEIAAIMELEKSRLLISRYFLMDEQVFETADNPIFPYGLEGVIYHEMAHMLDWTLSPGHRISGQLAFQEAFAQDVSRIPPEMIMTHQQRVERCEQYGGYLKLPPAEREKADLSLFVLQDEETFADAFAYLMTGNARKPIGANFNASIAAVSHVLEYYIGMLSKPYAPPSLRGWKI